MNSKLQSSKLSQTFKDRKYKFHRKHVTRLDVTRMMDWLLGALLMWLSIATLVDAVYDLDLGEEIDMSTEGQ